MPNRTLHRANPTTCVYRTAARPIVPIYFFIPAASRQKAKNQAVTRFYEKRSERLASQVNSSGAINKSGRRPIEKGLTAEYACFSERLHCHFPNVYRRIVNCPFSPFSTSLLLRSRLSYTQRTRDVRLPRATRGDLHRYEGKPHEKLPKVTGTDAKLTRGRERTIVFSSLPDPAKKKTLTKLKTLSRRVF